MTNNNLDGLDKKRFFGQLMYTVTYVHEKGFTHRNIKPSKILIR
jgi:serine/threonine protein kinase